MTNSKKVMTNEISSVFGKTVEDLSKEALKLKPKIKNGYIICITPRTGSTYLTHLLKSNVEFGYPNEWMNPRGIEKGLEKNNLSSFNQYINMLWDNHSSKDGVFGIEAPYYHLKILMQIIPLDLLLGKNHHWFHLMRENIVSQSISLYLAQQSGIYHSTDLEREGNTKQEIPKPVYDGKAIKFGVAKILKWECQYEKLFKDNDVNPVRISYEKIIKDPSATVELFKKTLGINKTIEFNNCNKIKKIGTNLNAEFEERFRTEYANYLSEVLNKRENDIEWDS